MADQGKSTAGKEGRASDRSPSNSPERQSVQDVGSSVSPLAVTGEPEASPGHGTIAVGQQVGGMVNLIPPWNIGYQLLPPPALSTTTRGGAELRRSPAAPAMPSPNKKSTVSAPNKRKPNEKPTTKQQFVDKGAIEKPGDGEDTKPSDKSCLTCLDQGLKCHGNDVDDGKCSSCRGNSKIDPKTGKQKTTRKKRVCLWLDQQNNVGTYAEAQTFHRTRRLPQNTAASIAQRHSGSTQPAGHIDPPSDALREYGGRATSVSREAEREPRDYQPESGEDMESDDEDDSHNIFGFLDGTSERTELESAVLQMADSGLVTADAASNLEALQQVVRGRVDSVMHDEDSADGTVRQARADTLQTVADRLREMAESDDSLSRAEMLSFLPDSHPLKGVRG